jgi:hypothetical protein
VKIDSLSEPGGCVCMSRRTRLIPTFVGCVIALGALTSGVLAIPQTFSQPSQFILRAGKPAEEFFRDSGAWASGAAIPGETAESAGKENSAVDEPGAVFGVGATSIKLVRDASGNLKETVVQYDAKTAGMTAQKLHEQLQANIAAFAGTKPANVSGKLRFATPDLVISLPRDAGAALEVRITRADAPAEAKAAARH